MMLTPESSAIVFKSLTLEPSLEDRNKVDEYLRVRDETDKIHVGDFIRMSSGNLKRVAHILDCGVQVSLFGSFHLGNCISFSGGLDPIIPFEAIIDTNESKLGRFWSCHNGHNGANREFGVYAPCRVYEEI